MSDVAQLLSDLKAREHRFGGTRIARIFKQPYRSLMPLAARKLGLTRPVAVPTFFGKTFHGVLPEAVTTQIWRSGYYSPEVCRSLIHVLRPGDTFVDIGGHFGFFSLLGAHLVGEMGKVFTVEAMPRTFAQLSINMRCFAESGIAKLHQGAAFDTNTTLKFKDFGLVASSLNTAFENRGDSRLAKEPKEVEVTATVTDELIKNAGLSAPRLIKVDAESAEIFVLRGLERTIRDHQPALIMEMGDSPDDKDPKSPAIFDFLKSRGYRAEVFHGETLKPFVPQEVFPYANVLFTAN